MEKMPEFNVEGEDKLCDAPNVTDPDYYKIILDMSDSMGYHVKTVNEGLSQYKDKLSRIDEATSIYVSRGDFSDDYTETEYLPIDQLSTSYYCSGCTDLYGAIVESTRSTIEKYNKLIEEGYEPRMTNILFSDGEHFTGIYGHEFYTFLDAKKIVNKAQEMGITMVFIDFGGANGDKPRELGFQSVYSPENSTEALVETIKDITNSCIRQSQSKISNSTDWMCKN